MLESIIAYGLAGVGVFTVIAFLWLLLTGQL